MPANLSPEYKAAEAAFRKTRDPRERLERLREMLRTIPKHKGTDHLQADIKRKLKELADELDTHRPGGAHGGPALVVSPEGAAQIALIGPPNCGKSALHARLTASGAHVADYPFTTQHPQPGMMTWQDVHFQLVDLPPVSPRHPVPWLGGALQTADACLLVTDLGEPDCVEQIEALHAELHAKRVTLTERWPAANASPSAAEEPDEDPFALRLPTLLIAAKADRLADADAELEAFRELTGWRYAALPVSATTGRCLGEIGPWLFHSLAIVRVYTKTPGKPADKQRPFTLRRGQTVEDVARLVHKDIAHSLKYARIWNASGLDGQHVGREHAVEDGDVVELHA